MTTIYEQFVLNLVSERLFNLFTPVHVNMRETCGYGDEARIEVEIESGTIDEVSMKAIVKLTEDFNGLATIRPNGDLITINIMFIVDKY